MPATATPIFEPIHFEWDGETFDCRAVVPWAALNQLERASRQPGGSAGVINFVRAAVLPEQRDRFDRHCLGVPPEEAGQKIISLTLRLIAEYTRRLPSPALVAAN